MNRNHGAGAREAGAWARLFLHRHRLGSTLGDCKVSTAEISNSFSEKRPSKGLPAAQHTGVHVLKAAPPFRFATAWETWPLQKLYIARI